MVHETPSETDPEALLTEQGLTIPAVPGAPAFDYLPYRLHSGVLYLAGQLAKEDNGEVAVHGRVGEAVEESEAARQMTLAALHAIAWLRDAAKGDLRRVEGILHLNVWVARGPGFDGISRLADHASRVFRIAFGDAGRHPRSVIGVDQLPRGAPVMIDLRAAIRPED